jgi:RNA polymerase sigma factor (sigma-70 family)
MDSLEISAVTRRAGEPQEGSEPLEAVELQELVRAAQRGDPLAMAGLLRAVAPYVGRICGAIALQDGDDAMQETMIQVLKHLRSLREPAALWGWVRRIAVREAIRVAEARARQVPVEQAAELAADDQPGLRLEVADTLRRLRPDQRAVLVLRDLEGFSEAEAAAVLGVEVGTVKSRLHRARRAFRDRWRP